MKRSIAIILVMALSLCLLAGCQSPKIQVTSITLSKTTADLEVGKSITLSVTIKPTDAEDKTVTWSSSNNTVATVSNGTVYGVSDGSVTISATATNGKTATCVVTVKTPSAYSKLTDEEKRFFNMFTPNLIRFNDPGSITIIDVSIADNDFLKDLYNQKFDYVVNFSGKNKLGGTVSKYYLLSSSKFAEGLPISTGEFLNTDRLNAALKEYQKQKGWI